MEKRLKFKNKRKDRDSAISIGSSSTGPPSQRQSATDLSPHFSQDSGLASRKESIDSVVQSLAEKQDQMRSVETTPDSPLGESGIGLSFSGLKAHQDVDKHTDTTTQTH